MKSSIQGKKISRRRAFKGLGDISTWKAHADKVYAEFKTKPGIFDANYAVALHYSVSVALDNLGQYMRESGYESLANEYSTIQQVLEERADFLRR